MCNDCKQTSVLTSALGTWVAQRLLGLRATVLYLLFPGQHVWRFKSTLISQIQGLACSSGLLHPKIFTV